MVPRAQSSQSSEGHAKMVEVLLLRGAMVESAIRSSDWDLNALHVACKGGHIEVVRLLIESNVDVNLPDRWRWTPLHHAAQGGLSGVVSLLLAKNATPNAQTAFGLTACHIAASKGDADTVLLLLDAGYDLKLTSRDKQRTALHSAAEGPHLEVIRLLLLRGADVSAKDYNGCNAPELVGPGKRTIDVKGVFSAHMEASFGELQDPMRVFQLSQETSKPIVVESQPESPKVTSNADKAQAEPDPNTFGGDPEVTSIYFDFSKEHKDEENVDQRKDADDAREADGSKSRKEWLRRCSEKCHESEKPDKTLQTPESEEPKPRSWAWSAATGILSVAAGVLVGTRDMDDVGDEDTKFIHEDYALFFAPFEFLSKSKKVTQATGASDDISIGPASAMVPGNQDAAATANAGGIPLIRLIEPTPPNSELSTPITEGGNPLVGTPMYQKKYY